MTGVLLASGGLDSSLVAAMHAPAIHLTVNYGQRNVANELKAAARIAKHYGAQHLTFEMNPWRAVNASSLLHGLGPLIGPDTIVPGRNAWLISLAVAVAAERSEPVVFIGCNATDADIYPDCRPQFLGAARRAAWLGSRVDVLAPLLIWDKARIGKECQALNVPTRMTWSCYAGGVEQCGECGACLTRKEALGVHRF